MKPRLSKAAARQVLADLRKIAAETRAEAHPSDTTDDMTRSAWCALLGYLGFHADTMGQNGDLLPGAAFPPVATSSELPVRHHDRDTRGAL